MMRYLPFIIISIVLYTVFFYKNQEPALLTVTPMSEKVIPLDFKKLAEQKQQTKNRFSESAKEPERSIVLTEGTQPSEDETVLETKTVEKVVLAESADPAKKVESKLSVSPMNTEEAMPLAEEVAPSTSQTELVASITEKTMPLEELKTQQQVENIIPVSPTQQTTLSKEKQLLASIRSTQASESALIKSEVYEIYLQFELPALPPEKTRVVAKRQMVEKSITDNQAPAPKLLATETPQESVINNLLKQKQGPAPTTLQANDITKEATSPKPKRTFKKQATVMKMTNEQGLQQAIAVSGNKPHYPEKAKMEKLQGAVTAKFIVNMKGKTKEPQVITSSGHQILDESVLEFIKTERFMPSLEGREKVTREQQFFFNFAL